jgi:hypothetical protein
MQVLHRPSEPARLIGHVESNRPVEVWSRHLSPNTGCWDLNRGEEPYLQGAEETDDSQIVLQSR